MTAALIACIGLLVQRGKSNGGNISEVRFQAALDVARANRDEIREIKWMVLAISKQLDNLPHHLEAQGKALGDAANAIQEVLRRK